MWTVQSAGNSFGYTFCISSFSLRSFIANEQEDKRQPYEEDIRVPLIVRGPNVAPNTHTSSIALSIDLVSGVRIVWYVVVVYCLLVVV